MRLLLLAILLPASFGTATAQFLPLHAGEGCAAKVRILSKPPGSPEASPAAFADPGIDALHYALRLTIVPSSPVLVGHVTMTASAAVDTVRTVLMDLTAPMTVDSVRANGVTRSWTRFPAGFSVELPAPVPLGGAVVLETFYHGVPNVTGFGSFVFSSYAGSPWVWSLSQPYGARDWWPCKDHPIDKADSVSVAIRVPTGLKAASNGLLLSVTDNGDGTATHHWVERYPIATYLVSIAVADYAEFSDWFRHAPGDSMQVLNYVLPRDLETARPALARTIPMLEQFTRLFGEYPFIAEKYGHAQFGVGGAMEHQTMTSTTTFEEDVIAHELAHQWFGDLITCANWQELWLNEGFATYSEALFREAVYGVDSYREHIASRMEAALFAPGTLYVQDTSRVSELFRYSRVYAKGASVLHMLRHVLGDSTFFRCIGAYVQDPRFRYGVATTSDLRAVCEDVSGLSLGPFFDQWVFGEGFPIYSADHRVVREGDTYLTTVTLYQEASGSSPQFFAMPVDILLTDGVSRQTIVARHAFDGQEFTARTSWAPSQVVIDPDGWILKDVIDPSGQLPASVVLDQNYPNPFNAGTTIGYELPGARNVRLEIFDALGRLVRTLEEGARDPGVYAVAWDGRDNHGVQVASGPYFARLIAGSTSLSRPMMYLR